MTWTAWYVFPDPRHLGLLIAPFGPGCYELRRQSSKELVLYGRAAHVALKMTSLLPAPMGIGTRNSAGSRDYCAMHIADLEYRTMACASAAEAVIEEARLRENKHAYKFKA